MVAVSSDAAERTDESRSASVSASSFCEHLQQMRVEMNMHTDTFWRTNFPTTSTSFNRSVILNIKAQALHRKALTLSCFDSSQLMRVMSPLNIRVVE